MARQKLDRETRKALLAARDMIEDVDKTDGNKAETRRRIGRIFESIMGCSQEHIHNNILPFNLRIYASVVKERYSW